MTTTAAAGPGALDWGDDAAQVVSQRYGGPVADLTALAAIPPKRRRDGMVVVVMTANPVVAVFDASSAATASATVIAPASGTGRWLIQGSSGGGMQVSLLAGQNETGTPAITLTGIAVGDQLEAFLVFVGGTPAFAARALTDFTITANTLTVGANAANNAANQYLVFWRDLT